MVSKVREVSNLARIPLLASLFCLYPLASSANAKVTSNWVNPSYGPWQSATIGGGGCIENVVFSASDPSRLYAYGDMCGAFRSDNGGSTWRMIHAGLPSNLGSYEFSGLLVDPRNADHVLVATGSQYGGLAARGGIYISTDGGTNWTKTLMAAWAGNARNKLFGLKLVRDPNNVNAILAASVGTGIFRSEDNGKTWADCGMKDLYSADIRFDQATPGRVYYCAVADPTLKMPGQGVLGGGFFRSDDGGKNWVKLSDESPNEIVQDRKNPATYYGIFQTSTIMRSTDGCKTWQPFAEGLPDLAGQKLKAIAAGPDFILTSTDRKAQYYRLNAGDTVWQPVQRDAWDESDYRLAYGSRGAGTAFISIDPRDPNHWISADWSNIYETRDAGKTSGYLARGVELTVTHAIVPDIQDPMCVYLGLADVGCFWSSDGGASYNNIYISGGGTNIKMIAQSPVDPNVIYQVGSNGWGYWNSDQVFVSTDRGKSYSRIKMQGTGLPDRAICDSVVVNPKDPKTIYLAVAGKIGPGVGGVYKSVDGGNSWTWMSQGMAEGKWFFQASIWLHGPELAISTDGSLMAISNLSHTAYRFDSATSLWTAVKISGPGVYYSVVSDPLKPGRYYAAVVEDGLYRSDDSGATWQSILPQSVQSVAADPRVRDRVAVGTRDGIMVSTDAGGTWTALDKNLPYRLYNKVGFAGNRLLAGTGGSGLFWMNLDKTLVAASK